MEKYPIGVQNFESLRNDGYIYVDKTQYVRQLVDSGKYYFLGRPRRFGKSLLLSTLHAFFDGKRELFHGLAIDSWDEWDWGKYPVIHIDLNAKDYTYKESLFERINEHLAAYETEYGIGTPASSLDERFRTVINTAYEKTGRRVAVLIDEYDKPILDTLHDDSMKTMHRDTLRAFYSVLKSADQYLKFCFLTGVTKFGQLNVFSGLNNLQDISLSDNYAGICGISEEELHEYFHEGVSLCAQEWGETVDEAYGTLKANYDGYHFSPKLLDVYNPWSVLNAIKERRIDTYWNATGGGSSFFHKLLESGKITLSDLDNARVSLSMLQGTQVDITNAIPVLYQSGYLTIKSYTAPRRMAVLKYPNLEVESGFLNSLLPAYSGLSGAQSEFAIFDFVDDVNAGDTEGFLKRMQTFFKSFPYENAVKSEKDFQNIMYCVMCLMGIEVQVERHSSLGSADMVVQTADYVYIFEFKVDKSPEEALEQIERRDYAGPFACDPRKLIKAGVEFSLSERTVTGWKIA